MAQEQLLHLRVEASIFRWFPVKDIDLNSGTLGRHSIDPTAINFYARLMRENLWDWHESERPDDDPIAIFVANSTSYPGDGHHRILAARKAGLSHVYARVTPGTLMDAKLYSLQSNTHHGLRLRSRDNRKKIEILLEVLNDRQDTWEYRDILNFLKLPKSSIQTVSKICR